MLWKNPFAYVTDEYICTWRRTHLCMYMYVHLSMMPLMTQAAGSWKLKKKVKKQTLTGYSLQILHLQVLCTYVCVCLYVYVCVISSWCKTEWIELWNVRNGWKLKLKPVSLSNGSMIQEIFSTEISYFENNNRKWK